MQTLFIGRDAGNQIVLNDNLVSRRHAQLDIIDSGQVMIKDLGSSNGTFVNGNRITQCYLKTGDVVKCGAVFLNWSQYLNPPSSSSQGINYGGGPQQGVLAADHDPYPATGQFGLNEVFKYLSSRIFEIGDLFKTTWDRKSSIFFLKGIPVVIILFATIVLSSKYLNGQFYFSPTMLAVFLFGVCPFISVYLLSLNNKVNVDKVALASGLVGFIQFCSVLCYGIYMWIISQNIYNNYSYLSGGGYESHGGGFNFFMVIILLFLIIVLINLAIAIFVSIYKYFISIGNSRSKAVYLIATTLILNLFFQFLSFYMFYLILKDNIGGYHF